MKLVLAFPGRVERCARLAAAAEALVREVECPGCSRRVDVRRGVIVGHGWRGWPVGANWELCPASWLSSWSPELVSMRAPSPAAVVSSDDYS